MTANRHILVLFLPIMFLALLSGALGFLASEGRETLGLMAIFGAVGAAIIFARPELGILLFTTSFFVTYGRLIPSEGLFSINNLLGLLFTVLLAFKIYVDRDLSFLKEKPLQVFFLVSIFLHIASRFAEQQLGNEFQNLDSTQAALRALTTRFVFLIFFVNFIRTLRDVKLVLWTVMVLILVSAVSGLGSSVEGTGLGGYRAGADIGIQAGGNANRLAFFCAVGIAILWFYRQMIRTKLSRMALTAAVTVLAITSLLTASRSGLLNLALLFILIVAKGRLDIKKQLQVVFVSVLIFYIGEATLSSTHTTRLFNIFPGNESSVKGTSSTEKRLQTIWDGLKMGSQNPLRGVGIGNFTLVRLQEFGRVGSPHNSYLWAFAEGGIPALFLYVVLFALTLRYLVGAENSSNPEIRAIAGGLRVSTILFLFFSFFAQFWLNITLYLLVGLAIVLAKLQRQESPVNFAARANHQAAPNYEGTSGAKKQLWAGV